MHWHRRLRGFHEISRYIAMCAAVVFSVLSPGFLVIVASNSTSTLWIFPSSTGIPQSNQNTWGRLHSQYFRNLPGCDGEADTTWTRQCPACVICVVAVAEDVIAMLCNCSPAVPKMFTPCTSAPKISEWWEHIHKPCFFPNAWAICKANFMERARIELLKPLLKTKWKNESTFVVWGQTSSIPQCPFRSTFCSVVEDHVENNFNALTMKLSLMQRLLKMFQNTTESYESEHVQLKKRKIMENHLRSINSRGKTSSFLGHFSSDPPLQNRNLEPIYMMSQASNHGFESNNGSTNPIS